MVKLSSGDASGMSGSTSKYLDQYAEPEAREALALPGPFKHVLVIPAFNESFEVLNRLEGLPNDSDPILVVLVVNCPESMRHDQQDSAQIAAFQQAVENTQALAREIRARYKRAWSSEGPSKLDLFQFDSVSSNALLLVDRSQEGCRIPPKQGVGLARKIGADIACGLIRQGQVASPWIRNSDGDVELPEAYFEAEGDRQDAALIYPFVHDCSEHSELAVPHLLYEISLYYYVSGLAWAGSPYAYQTIGSTLAINADHYARVRGFPRRSAGEDFYVLNKLAKTGRICQLEQPVLHIQARTSTRVPFGTGAAVEKLTQMQHPVNEYRYYDPIVFSYLRAWLQSLDALWEDAGRSKETKRADAGILGASAVEPSAIKNDVDPELLKEALKEMGVEEGLANAFRQAKDRAGFLRHVHTWFDAFRTLKFIHFIRDKRHESIALDKMLASKPFISIAPKHPHDSLQVLRNTLNGFRKVTVHYTGL